MFLRGGISAKKKQRPMLTKAKYGIPKNGSSQ
jgi:hypothetical protein